MQLTEALNDNEEQKRQVQNLKRKSQRLNADMQDIKLHHHPPLTCTPMPPVNIVARCLQLTEALNDNEEQKRQVQNLKRKSQRLNADMQDIKLHLEEQVTRNSDLEKKQRK